LADISVKSEFYVATGWPRVEERIRVLKYGPMFAVFDRYGNIRSSGLGEHGIYYRGTRYLSRLTLTLGETPPLFLSSGVRTDNALFSADLTNVDLLVEDKVVLGRGTVHVVRSRLLWDGVCYEQFRVTNYGTSPVNLPLRIEFAADFADIFEVRGVHRARRGERLPDIVEKDQVTLHYRGLDGVNRCTHICCFPGPSEISGSHLVMEADLNPRDTAKFQFTVRCEQSQHAEVKTFDHALAAIGDETTSALNGLCTIRTSNHRFDEWLNRSLADVHMMTMGNAETNFPYAGVPWFSTVFGRDGIITALECLWLKPDIARGVLEYLAATQAQESNPAAEADPGKIVHETRRGEMAALGEIPFGCYYGSVDATPLFVILAGAYFRRTGDLEFVRSLWPNIERALTWIDRYGDRDGDGFVEYQRQSEKGLVQQGWKDSSDSVFHADGKLAQPPIALCEVQGYVYAAKMHAASIALALGDHARSELLKRQARDLQQEFDKAFWCEELSTYALALDRYKKPCRVRTSNAGHCLFTRIADENKARRIADTLLGEDSFSGWGVRTVSSLERNYNPISYHNGSVWPHDNALLATGLANYGMTSAVARLLDAVFEASSFFEMSRLPELICGLHRRAGEGPTLYPVACSPQAWSAGAAFMLFAAALGMSLDACERRVVLDRPVLPSSISSAELQGLQLGNALVDLHLERRPPKVHVEIVKRSGDVDAVVLD
jgi:glycogen debranching enzyme